jgi:transposase
MTWPSTTGMYQSLRKSSARSLVRTGAHWGLLPHDFPRWEAVAQQTYRWFRAGCFAAIVHDLRLLLRTLAERAAHPSATILDARTLQSTPESAGRAGDDGHERRKGSKLHAAVDTLGHLLAFVILPAAWPIGWLPPVAPNHRLPALRVAAVPRSATGPDRRPQRRRSC